MNTDDLIKESERLIDLGNNALKTEFVDAHHTIWVSTESFGEFRASSLSYLRKVFGESHPYYREFNEKLVGSLKATTNWGIGIIKAAKNEVESGWLTSLKGIVSAEVFSDFLEMADYLLGEEYKDASAVMIGSVLEQHLRDLWTKHGMPTTNGREAERAVHPKAEFVNGELAKKGVYGKLDQKNVTAWLDLRNKAAHGKYDQYNADQVKMMLLGVSEFVARTKR
ncbi:MAG: hypothetical protein ABSD38_28665 [Syntrophorhabdales bacterium]